MLDVHFFSFEIGQHQEGDGRNQQKQDQVHRRAESPAAVPEHLEGDRVQHRGGITRPAVRQHEHLLEHFEAGDQTEHDVNADRLHHKRQFDAEKLLKRIRSVDLRGFSVIARDREQTGHKNNHVKAGALPHVDEADRIHDDASVHQPLLSQSSQSDKAEKLVEEAVGMQQRRKQDADDNKAEHGRKEKNGAKQPLESDPAAQGDREQQSKHVFPDTGHEGEQNRVADRQHQVGVFRYFDEVVEPGKPDRIAISVPIRKRVDEAEQGRKNKQRQINQQSGIQIKKRVKPSSIHGVFLRVCE